MILVELTLMRPVITGYEPKDREIRAFSTKENADVVIPHKQVHGVPMTGSICVL